MSTVLTMSTVLAMSTVSTVSTVQTVSTVSTAFSAELPPSLTVDLDITNLNFQRFWPSPDNYLLGGNCQYGVEHQSDVHHPGADHHHGDDQAMTSRAF